MERTKTQRLVTALITGFSEHMARRCAELGVAVDDELARAVAAGVRQLETDLHELLTLPAQDQADSPLELVRRATVPVTAALAERGVSPADRDEWDKEINPDDPYALYPASSHDLGEETWRLHLEWGVHKAEAVAGMVPAEPGPRMPAVALFGVPASDRDELRSALESRDFAVKIWHNPAAIERSGSVILVFVHLGHPLAHETIRQLAGQRIRVIAVAEQADDLVLPGILALGAEDVVETGRLLSRFDDLLPGRA